MGKNKTIQVYEITDRGKTYPLSVSDKKIELDIPQTEEQVKEVDILDNKLVKWVEDNCPPIDLNKYPSLVVKLVSENKRLKEVNKLLVDALRDFVNFEWNNLSTDEETNMALSSIIFFSQAALKEANLIK